MPSACLAAFPVVTRLPLRASDADHAGQNHQGHERHQRCPQQKVMSELLNNNVQIYQFPVSDETIAETNKTMNSHLPFAIVGSNDFVKVSRSHAEFPVQFV